MDLIILTTRLERERCLFHRLYYSITFISEISRETWLQNLFVLQAIESNS